MSDDHYGLWPKPGTLGQFRVRCSCMRWELTGTAGAILKASRQHDDSPWQRHVVSIANGGRRIDGDDESPRQDLS